MAAKLPTRKSYSVSLKTPNQRSFANGTRCSAHCSHSHARLTDFGAVSSKNHSSERGIFELAYFWVRDSRLANSTSQTPQTNKDGAPEKRPGAVGQSDS